MALHKNKKRRFATSTVEKNDNIEQQTNKSMNGANVQRSANTKGQGCEPDRIPSNEREQRGQRDQMLSNESQQRAQRDQLPSRQQKGQGDSIPPNEREQRSERNQTSSNLEHNNLRQVGGSDGRVDGQIYEYTVEEHKWRDYKCFLKGRGYDDDTDLNTLYDNCPEPDVEYGQWVNLVNFWRSNEGQKRSKRSKESHEKAKVKPIHTTGTKSHARLREEMKKELNKSPSCTQVYLRFHEHESEADITNKIKSVATEQGTKK